MECAQVTEEQRLWTETQIQKAKHNAWPTCLASVYLTNPPVAESRLKPLLKQLSPVRSTWSKEYGRRRFDAACIPDHVMLSAIGFEFRFRISNHAFFRTCTCSASIMQPSHYDDALLILYTAVHICAHDTCENAIL